MIGTVVRCPETLYNIDSLRKSLTSHVDHSQRSKSKQKASSQSTRTPPLRASQSACFVLLPFLITSSSSPLRRPLSPVPPPAISTVFRLVAAPALGGTLLLVCRDCCPASNRLKDSKEFLCCRRRGSSWLVDSEDESGDIGSEKISPPRFPWMPFNSRELGSR